MKIKKKYIILFLTFLLILSNAFWLKVYHREQEKLKHTLIPSLSQDYFTSQKIITEYVIQKENNQINVFNPSLELRLGSEFPYNSYFQTKKDYETYRKENANQKDVPLILQNPDYPIWL